MLFLWRKSMNVSPHKILSVKHLDSISLLKSVFLSHDHCRVENVPPAAGFKAFWSKLTTRSSARSRISASFSKRGKNRTALQIWSPKIRTTSCERGLFPTQVCITHEDADCYLLFTVEYIHFSLHSY